MTTIAYRDGVLAGDTRLTIGDNVTSNDHSKVTKLRDGRLFGWCGGLEQSDVMLISLRKKLGVPTLDNLACLLIEPDGTIREYEGNIWAKRKAPYMAIGSGAICALSAMDAGASAKEAVKIAIKRNVTTGGRVTSVSLKGKKKK